MIVIGGRFRIAPEHVDRAIAAMARVTRLTREEPGCPTYSFSRDLIEPDLFHMYGEWVSTAALTTHFEAAYMREWRAESRTCGMHDTLAQTYEAHPAAAPG